MGGIALKGEHDGGHLAFLHRMNACLIWNVCNVGLRQRIQRFVPVGQVDEQSMLVQEGLDLILVNTSALAHDLFYQLVRSWPRSCVFLH